MPSSFPVFSAPWVYWHLFSLPVDMAIWGWSLPAAPWSSSRPSSHLQSRRSATAMDKKGWGHAEIQPTDAGQGLMVKLKKSEESVGKMAEEIGAVLNENLSGNRFTIEGTSEIGASVSKDLAKMGHFAIRSLCWGLFYIWPGGLNSSSALRLPSPHFTMFLQF